MLLNEQLYKNLYRSYFQGRRKDYNKNKSLYKLSYYTTNPLYAWYYVSLSPVDGVVTEYKLKNAVNIFNARSKTDFNKLHSYINEHSYPFSYDELEDLKDKDWLYNFSENKRNQLIDIITDLGYDGFFNYEYDKKFKKRLADEYENPEMPETDNNPSIGVINPDIFIKVKDYNSLQEMKELKQFQDYRQIEIEALKRGFLWAKDRFGEDTAYNCTLAQKDMYLTLDEDDILDALEDVRDKKSESDLKILKALIKSGRLPQEELEKAKKYKEDIKKDPFSHPPSLTDFKKWLFWEYAKNAQKK